jgi:deoxyxylulose-5-phosphate synthase
MRWRKDHLGASLGVVELTIAFALYCLILKDLLVWDVGHQAMVIRY